MESSLWTLPTEIRLQIYDHVFGSGKIILQTQDEDLSASLIPRSATCQNRSPRSSQLLRTSRAILHEARPILYANTTFHVVSHAFAGKLPTRITDGHPSAPYIKHLVYQVDCDLLKHFYHEDLRLDLADVANWSCFEIRCKADTWRDSFMGEWCDREAFVNGRAQVIEYARVFFQAMRDRQESSIALCEDRSQLGRGRVMVNVSQGSHWQNQRRQSKSEQYTLIEGS
jgi:hypothetical protein